MCKELVLGAELEQTAHRRIFSANEPFPDRAAFAEIEARLRDMTAVENRTGLRDCLLKSAFCAEGDAQVRAAPARVIPANEDDQASENETCNQQITKAAQQRCAEASGSVYRQSE